MGSFRRRRRGMHALAACAGCCMAVTLCLGRKDAASANEWIALEEDTPEDVWERQMNTTAAMFRQWHVVRDVRVLPNPDYMRKDADLPAALQGTSVDEVAKRAVASAIADMEQQQADEDDVWAHPDDDVIASIVPEAADEAADGGADPENEEEKEEDGNDEDEERARAENLKKILWIQNARRAAGYVAASQTERDRMQIRTWEEEHPSVFPEHIVFPLAEYPDGRQEPERVIGMDDDDDEG